MALEDPEVMLRGLVNASDPLVIRLAIHRLIDYIVDPEGEELDDFDVLDIIAQVLVSGDATLLPRELDEDGNPESLPNPLRDTLKFWFNRDPDEDEEKEN